MVIKTKMSLIIAASKTSAFQNQRSTIQIQSSAKLKLNIVYGQLYRKDESEGKEAGNGPFFKKCKRVLSGKVHLLMII